jgi:hypothetical protein
MRSGQEIIHFIVLQVDERLATPVLIEMKVYLKLFVLLPS